MIAEWIEYELIKLMKQIRNLLMDLRTVDNW